MKPDFHEEALLWFEHMLDATNGDKPESVADFISFSTTSNMISSKSFMTGSANNRNRLNLQQNSLELAEKQSIGTQNQHLKIDFVKMSEHLI